MPGIKTAISLNKELLHKIDKIAQKVSSMSLKSKHATNKIPLEKLEKFRKPACVKS